MAGHAGTYLRTLQGTPESGSSTFSARSYDDEPLDATKFGPRADIDALNELDIDTRRNNTIPELMGEIESDGGKHEEMLSLLTDDHEHHLLACYSASLGEFLRSRDAGNRGGHDREHMAHIQAGLTGTR